MGFVAGGGEMGIFNIGSLPLLGLHSRRRRVYDAHSMAFHIVASIWWSEATEELATTIYSHI